ncbi:MAG: hypothetical protein RR622_05105, partial [Hydrogenoanaerobacterium sp.]
LYFVLAAAGGEGRFLIIIICNRTRKKLPLYFVIAAAGGEGRFLIIIICNRTREKITALFCPRRRRR